MGPEFSTFPASLICIAKAWNPCRPTKLSPSRPPGPPRPRAIPWAKLLLTNFRYKAVSVLTTRSPRVLVIPSAGRKEERPRSSRGEEKIVPPREKRVPIPVTQAAAPTKFSADDARSSSHAVRGWSSRKAKNSRSSRTRTRGRDFPFSAVVEIARSGKRALCAHAASRSLPLNTAFSDSNVLLHGYCKWCAANAVGIQLSPALLFPSVISPRRLIVPGHFVFSIDRSCITSFTYTYARF